MIRCQLLWAKTIVFSDSWSYCYRTAYPLQTCPAAIVNKLLPPNQTCPMHIYEQTASNSPIFKTRRIRKTQRLQSFSRSQFTASPSCFFRSTVPRSYPWPPPHLPTLIFWCLDFRTTWCSRPAVSALCWMCNKQNCQDQAGYYRGHCLTVPSLYLLMGSKLKPPIRKIFQNAVDSDLYVQAWLTRRI